MTSMWHSSTALTRRTILGVSATTVGFMLVGSKVWAEGTASKGISGLEFRHLSATLTGRSKLDPAISARALAALQAEDAAFAGKAKQLLDAMTSASFTDMRHYHAFIAAHPELSPIAEKIISAWYLGYTGKPEGESATDNARFVSYAGALMYEPTRDATIVPTYSRGQTNYWVDPPASLATD